MLLFLKCEDYSKHFMLTLIFSNRQSFKARTGVQYIEIQRKMRRTEVNEVQGLKE